MKFNRILLALALVGASFTTSAQEAENTPIQTFLVGDVGGTVVVTEVAPSMLLTSNTEIIEAFASANPGVARMKNVEVHRFASQEEAEKERGILIAKHQKLGHKVSGPDMSR